MKKSSLSVVVVLPASMWAMIPTFLVDWAPSLSLPCRSTRGRPSWTLEELLLAVHTIVKCRSIYHWKPHLDWTLQCLACTLLLLLMQPGYDTQLNLPWTASHPSLLIAPIDDPFRAIRERPFPNEWPPPSSTKVLHKVIITILLHCTSNSNYNYSFR